MMYSKSSILEDFQVILERNFRIHEVNDIICSSAHIIEFLFFNGILLLKIIINAI